MFHKHCSKDESGLSCPTLRKRAVGGVKLCSCHILKMIIEISFGRALKKLENGSEIVRAGKDCCKFLLQGFIRWICKRAWKACEPLEIKYTLVYV